jgi:hypothetical protein
MDFESVADVVEWTRRKLTRLFLILGLALTGIAWATGLLDMLFHWISRSVGESLGWLFML